MIKVQILQIKRCNKDKNSNTGFVTFKNFKDKVKGNFKCISKPVLLGCKLFYLEIVRDASTGKKFDVTIRKSHSEFFSCEDEREVEFEIHMLNTVSVTKNQVETDIL